MGKIACGGFGLLVVLFCSAGFAQPLGTLSEHMHVDQFGYPPTSKKVAVLANPQTGFNAAGSYTPGSTIEVRTLDDDAIVFSAAPVPWNGGEVHEQSGDQVWWFDFSALGTWGRYYLYDPANQRHSPPFRIHPEVYNQALYDAVRSFYYQRCNIAKEEPYAEANWTDGASHTADTRCRLVYTPDDAATERDLSGGWYDAGDYNKYVNFSLSTLLQLIRAYRENPGLWNSLRLDIPESDTNNTPDILDEIRWELDWLQRMQAPNGAVPGKVSVTDFSAASPPSADNALRYYGNDSTTASLTVAAVCAAAAAAFREGGEPVYADQLVANAERSWNWAEANPFIEFDNSFFQSQNPEDLDFGFGFGVTMRKLVAAVFLYEATGKAIYRESVENNVNESHLVQWFYAYPFETAIQDALFHFTTLDGVDPEVRNLIRDRKDASMGNDESLPPYLNQVDAYRAYLKTADYTWGSNRTKADMGLIFVWHNTLGIDPANATNYRDAAGGFLHYLHGTNPLGLCMLSNMSHAGVTRSAKTFYHAWFGDGTIWDDVETSRGPPPGFLPGGPNPTYSPDDSYNGPPISPPMNQPTQKSYRQWNTSFPENSWEITENGIYYQSAYVALASKFATFAKFADWTANEGEPGAATASDTDGDGVQALLEYVMGFKLSQANPSPLSGRVNNEAFEVTFPLVPRYDTELVLETTTDLSSGNWTPISTKRRAGQWSTANVVEADGAVTFTFDQPSPRRHYRLRVNLIGLGD